MLHLLKAEQCHSLQPILGQDIPLYCQGILTGKYQGKVMVDNPDRPQSALVIKDIWCHLLGDPGNDDFNEGLKGELAEKKVIGEEINVLFFINPSPAWLNVLHGLVENRQPIELPRCLYTTVSETIVHTPDLPEGFTLHLIDELLPGKVDGELPGDVQKVLTLRQSVTAAADEMAFGFVALHGRICAAWSVIDFIVGNIGEIRLVTENRYRRLGLAFTTSAATIAYGFSQGLEQINWDAAAANIPSIRTAQKLGLRLLYEPKEYILIFPEVGYFINLAWSHLDAHRFAQAHSIAEQMISSDKEVLVQYGHFLAAAAWAGLEDKEAALNHLQQAIDAGFDDLFEMENSQPLKRLHGLPEWEQLLRQMQPG
jgi:tetratricopeptide (TPR) repeat protein